MPSDNITPFRRSPKPARPQQQGGWGFKTHRGKAVLVQSLTILAFVLNFVGAAAGQVLFPIGADMGAVRLAFWIGGLAVSIAAVLVALTNRDQGMPWANTHHEHALRTLFIGYAIWTFGVLLTYIHGALMIVTIFVQLGVAIWALARASIGLVLAMMRKPVAHPRGWLV